MHWKTKSKCGFWTECQEVSNNDTYSQINLLLSEHQHIINYPAEPQILNRLFNKCKHFYSGKLRSWWTLDMDLSYQLSVATFRTIGSILRHFYFDDKWYRFLNRNWTVWRKFQTSFDSLIVRWMIFF